MGKIVWIASYPKSGNTWVRAFLANLIADRPAALSLRELSNYCEDEARPEFYTELSGRPSETLSLAEICALRPQVHARIAARNSGFQLVKTHNFAGAFDGYVLHNQAVTAGAIYILRNPLDIVLSMVPHFGLSIDEGIRMLASDATATANDSLFVSQILGSWSTHVESWSARSSPNVVVVRYEDLIAGSSLKPFLKIAKLVGLGQDIARVKRAMAHASFKTLAGLELREGFAEASNKSTKFFRAGTANQWRQQLTAEQIAGIVSAHRVSMKRFFYLPPAFSR